MLHFIDGKALAAKIRQEIKAETDALKQKGIIPGLCVILVGDDPASHTYVNNKEKACQEVGFHSTIYRLPADTSEETLLTLIDKLNHDQAVHGILVQLPLPAHLNETKITGAISVRKDVDGFLPENLGALLIGEAAFEPCTPKGCLRLIREAGIEISGKNAVVVGRSNIVGKPMAIMLLQENATVTVCHSKTADLSAHLRKADIIVAAVGQAGFITGDMIKDGAVVIDVGTNRLADGKLVGDVDRESLGDKTCYLTPVPGGVGPMTIAMLLQNTLESAKR